MQMYLDWKEDDEGNKHTFSLMELDDVELQTIVNALEHWHEIMNGKLGNQLSGNDAKLMHQIGQEKARAAFISNRIKTTLSDGRS